MFSRVTYFIFNRLMTVLFQMASLITTFQTISFLKEKICSLCKVFSEVFDNLGEHGLKFHNEWDNDRKICHFQFQISVNLRLQLFCEQKCLTFELAFFEVDGVL